MSRLRSIREMDRMDWRLFAGASMRLLLVKPMLSTIGLKRTAAILASGGGKRTDQLLAERSRRALQRAVSNVPLRTNCLDRAIALWWLLASRGVSSTVRIGVRKDDAATLAAHAWLEHGGTILFDEGEGGFLPLAEPILTAGKP